VLRCVKSSGSRLGLLTLRRPLHNKPRKRHCLSLRRRLAPGGGGRRRLGYYRYYVAVRGRLWMRVRESSSLNRTPVHSAQLTPPNVHQSACCSAGTIPRPQFEAHSRTYRLVTCDIRKRSDMLKFLARSTFTTTASGSRLGG